MDVTDEQWAQMDGDERVDHLRNQLRDVQTALSHALLRLRSLEQQTTDLPRSDDGLL